MLTEIYYFSGTGNSLAVARKIKNALTDKAEIIVIPKTSLGTATMADRIMSYLVHDGIDKEKWALCPVCENKTPTRI